MGTPYAEVIGDPIAQSKSPAIHQHWLDRTGMDADYRATRVEIDGLSSYFEKRRDDPDWRGCNVTMPLKQAIGRELDSIEPSAARIGSVNTVYRNADGALVGTSTDGAGFLEPLEPALRARHLFRMARILGAGGAARAIAAALAQQGFVLVIAARDERRAAQLLVDVDPGGEHHVAPLSHFADRTDFAFDDREGCFDLVVNTTPMGMRGQPPLPFDWSHAPPGAIAYDIVTDPVETEFLHRAKAAGHVAVDGMAMLIGQAAHAFPLFFGEQPDRSDDALLRRALLG